MTTLINEPRFSVDSIRLLQRFQNSLRSRVYNLVEDHVRETGDSTVSPNVVEKCIRQAVEELVADTHQQTLFDAR